LEIQGFLFIPGDLPGKGGYYTILYNNQMNARALIGQSAMIYCASKLMEISRVF